MMDLDLENKVLQIEMEVQDRALAALQAKMKQKRDKADKELRPRYAKLQKKIDELHKVCFGFVCGVFGCVVYGWFLCIACNVCVYCVVWMNSCAAGY